jgi:ribosome-associated protein
MRRNNGAIGGLAFIGRLCESARPFYGVPRMSNRNRFEERDELSGPSKTQLKQAMHELQELGTALLALSREQLAAIRMDERLREALFEFGRMPTREARRRHMQYIGKLLRDTDAEPARRALAVIRAGEAALLAEAERWRERLLAEEAAFTEWVAAYPTAAARALRTQVRNVQRELAAAAEAGADLGARGKNRAFRELFQKIRTVLQQSRAAVAE